MYIFISSFSIKACASGRSFGFFSNNDLIISLIYGEIVEGRGAYSLSEIAFIIAKVFSHSKG
jgi:hypothetical protein